MLINIISSNILCDFVTFFSLLAPTVDILFYLLVSHKYLSFSIEHKKNLLFPRFDHFYCPVFKFGIPFAYSNTSGFFFISVTVFLTPALLFVFIQATCSFITIYIYLYVIDLFMFLFTSWASFFIFEF